MSELGEVIYQSKFTAQVPKSPLAAAMPDLSEDLLSDLAAATSEVAAELGDHIRCRPALNSTSPKFVSNCGLMADATWASIEGRSFCLCLAAKVLPPEVWTVHCSQWP